MSKAAIFPYGISLKEGGKLSIFPAAEVGFNISKGERVSLIFLIDSGATVSALPVSDAAVLGVSLNNSRVATIQGVDGGVVFGRSMEVGVRLGSEKLKLPVIFLEDDSIPRILGRDGVFNRFSIIFEEEKHRTVFLASKSKEAISVRKILDKIM